MSNTKSSALTRRSVVAGAATLGAAGVLTLGLPASAAEKSASNAAGATFPDTISWNAEYDVVVVGFGGAGGVASIYAADAGARVLLCDAAPYGNEGGNTRYAAQMMCGTAQPSDADAMYTYYRDGLAGNFDVDEEALRTYTDGMANMGELVKYLGVEEPFFWPTGTIVTPEYPEYQGGEVVGEYFVHMGGYDSALWKTIRSAVLDRADAIDVWYESPALHLIQDPDTKTVVGVEISRADKSVLVRALNGVVLACGGFENNPEMIQDYLGSSRYLPIGTLYNKGDGVRMGIEVGADLWHMEAFETLGILCGNAWPKEGDERARLEPSYATSVSLISIGSEEFGQGSVIVVGDDGSRFINEAENARHGHVYDCGYWVMPRPNHNPHIVFDQAQLDFFKETGRVDEQREAMLVSAATPEELAEKIGADPAILAKTVADWNFFCEQGNDYAQGRDPQTMRAFDGTVYYAGALVADILNTQGGPRRNARAQVMGTDGEPIPHLYSAGELGGMCAFQYQSGGNLAECMVYGKIAGTNAAEAKEELPQVAGLAAVDNDILFEAGKASDEPFAEAEVELAPGEYLGSSTACMGNKIQLKVSVDDYKVTAVEVIRQSETPEYGVPALDELVARAVEKGSDEIDVVAGATMTSVGFKQALAVALSQV